MAGVGVILEDIARLGPMLAVAGMTVAWIAEAGRPAGGRGFIADLVAATPAALVGGGLAWGAMPPPAGMLAMLGIGIGSSALAICAQRTLWPSAAPDGMTHGAGGERPAAL